MLDATTDRKVSKELDKVEINFIVDKHPTIKGTIEAAIEIVNNSNYLIHIHIMEIAEDFGIVPITEGIPVYKLRPHSRTMLRHDNGVKTRIERNYIYFLNKGFGNYAVAVHIFTQLFFAQRIIEPKIRKG